MSTHNSKTFLSSIGSPIHREARKRSRLQLIGAHYGPDTVDEPLCQVDRPSSRLPTKGEVVDLGSPHKCTIDEACQQLDCAPAAAGNRLALIGRPVGTSSPKSEGACSSEGTNFLNFYDDPSKADLNQQRECRAGAWLPEVVEILSKSEKRFSQGVRPQYHSA